MRWTLTKIMISPNMEYKCFVLPVGKCLSLARHRFVLSTSLSSHPCWRHFISKLQLVFLYQRKKQQHNELLFPSVHFIFLIATSASNWAKTYKSLQCIQTIATMLAPRANHENAKKEKQQTRSVNCLVGKQNECIDKEKKIHENTNDLQANVLLKIKLKFDLTLYIFECEIHQHFYIILFCLFIQLWFWFTKCNSATYLVISFKRFKSNGNHKSRC